MMCIYATAVYLMSLTISTRFAGFKAIQAFISRSSKGQTCHLKYVVDWISNFSRLSCRFENTRKSHFHNGFFKKQK